MRSANIGDLLDDVLSVERLQIFKPARPVYEMVGQRFLCAVDEVLFVSSNGWDAAGAADFGFHTAWINRAGAPIERLPGTPSHVLPDLGGIPTLAGSL